MERRNFLKNCVVAAAAGPMVISSAEGSSTMLKLGTGKDTIELHNLVVGDRVLVKDVTAVPFGGGSQELFFTTMGSKNRSHPKALGQFTGGKVKVTVENQRAASVKFIGSVPCEIHIQR